MYFSHLRTTPFDPTFEWVGSTQVCADMINRPHEDYPKYVGATKVIIEKLGLGNWVYNSKLLLIHEGIFSDKSFAGEWRKVNVYVGQHLPPNFTEVEKLMDELEESYAGRLDDIESLIEWYKDLETIHPFQDGNGRVGGVVVAVRSHELHPEKGWLAPNQ